MKLALGIIFTNEFPWLKLHLDVFRNSFDGIVGITDPKTTDGSIEYLHSLGAAIIEYPWAYNWGDFATKLCQYAESLGYDAIMRVDPDECLMPYAGTEIKLMLQKDATLLCFPRRNFMYDRKHIWDGTYPDWQIRAWRLNRGIIVQGDKHEGVNFSQHDLRLNDPDPDHCFLRVSEPHIYHYGWGSKTGIRYQEMKYQSQAQIAAGGPPEVAWPVDRQDTVFAVKPYIGTQPQDPDVIGLYAPYDS